MNYEDFELNDKPSEIGVSIAILAAVGDLPDHFIRTRDIRFNRGSKVRIANRLQQGQYITNSDVENAFVKNDTSGTVMTKVNLEYGWREKRYNIALVVNITEYNGSTAISRTTRTILGWVTETPHPVHGLPDNAVININTVVTRDMVDNGGMLGTIRNTSKLTGKSSDEIIAVDKKVLLGSNISNKIQFESDYNQGNTAGGFTSTIINDSYNNDTKISNLASDSNKILTDAINNSLFDNSNEPIGVGVGSPEVDEFILLLNSHTVNQLGAQTGLKSFTWGAFKTATKWSNYNKLEVFDSPAAPIFNPSHNHGSTESIEHDTRDIYINDIGFPLVHAVCTIIEKYGLSLLNLSFNWVAGSDVLVYASIVRPLDNSELPPVIIQKIQEEARLAFMRYTTIVGVQMIEVIFDGGFGKSSGIALKVNGAPNHIPLVVSPAQTSLYNESVVNSNDNRLVDAAAFAIGGIMREHGKSAGGYMLDTPITEPILTSPMTGTNVVPTMVVEQNTPGHNRIW